MKKKLLLLLIILTILAASGAGYCLTGQTSFDQSFQGYAQDPPAAAAASFTVVREGNFGFTGAPVTFEQGRPYREMLAALRAQKYLPLPSFPGAPDGGTAIYCIQGCTPSCMAYWDGSFLWLPGRRENEWRRFLPLPPHLLGEKIETICNQSY